MMNLIITFLILKVFAADINQLNSVAFEDVGKTPTLTFVFEKPVALESIDARFIRRTVEWDLASTKLKKDKLFINVSKNDINNVYASQNDSNSIRVRVNMDHGKMASNYHERIEYSVEGKTLRLKMNPDIGLITNNITEINRVYSIASKVDSETTQKIEDHVASVSTLKVEDTEEQAIDANAPEDKIPLKVKKKSSSPNEIMSFQKLAGGFFVVALLLTSALLVVRKLKSKNADKAFNHESIKVISQKYLGPKRNLVLIRVTGEYLLLGVTDNNISLIKNLNVVDDEIPELTNKNFDEVLNKKEKTAISYGRSENEDSFSMSSLDDVKKIFKKKRYTDEMDF